MAEKICPYCHSVNDGQGRACKVCGHSLLVEEIHLDEQEHPEIKLEDTQKTVLDLPEIEFNQEKKEYTIELDSAPITTKPVATIQNVPSQSPSFLPKEKKIKENKIRENKMEKKDKPSVLFVLASIVLYLILATGLTVVGIGVVDHIFGSHVMDVVFPKTTPVTTPIVKQTPQATTTPQG